MATKQEILAPLSDEQRDVVINYKGKIDVSACPGSGKTTCMVAVIQYMLKDGVAPSKILAFTFTRKAAKELRERVRKKVGADADKVMISTYHSFCARLLRQCATYAGREANFTIYDEDDKKKVLGEIIKSFSKSSRCVDLNYGIVAGYISRFKADNLSPAEAKKYRSDTSFGKASAFIYESYENEMRKLNAFDFDDLPYFAYRIVKNNPEILAAISSRFEYILSDENQDSNKQNMNFILLLGSHSENIITVGDLDQSIYAFRGSDVNNIINVIKSEGFVTKNLSTNYRSTKTIVEAADCLISNNKSRNVKKITTDNPLGENIEVVTTLNAKTQAEYVAKKISELKSTRPEFRYSDFCVLARTQSQIASVEEQLLLKNIPYSGRGIVPFYARAVIKDIVAYLRFAYNENDQIALSRIINIPKRGIGDSSLQKIKELLKQHNISDIIINEQLLHKTRLSNKSKSGVLKFFRLIEDIRELILAARSPGDVIDCIIKASDYLSYLEGVCQNENTLQSRKADLDELVFIASAYSSVTDFLNNTALDETTGEDTKNTDAISLITMHSSKGLEYKVVFIIGADDDSMPHSLSHKSMEDIEEERRLFYVAMTRAKEKLVICYTKLVEAQFCQAKSVSMSRFIKEIPDKYITFSRF